MKQIQLSLLIKRPVEVPDYSGKPEPNERLSAAAKKRGHHIYWSVCEAGYWLIKDGIGKGVYFQTMKELRKAVYSLAPIKEPESIPDIDPRQRARFQLFRDAMQQPRPWPSFKSAKQLDAFLQQLKEKGLVEDFLLTVHCWSSPSKGLYGPLPDFQQIAIEHDQENR